MGQKVGFLVVPESQSIVLLLLQAESRFFVVFVRWGQRVGQVFVDVACFLPSLFAEEEVGNLPLQLRTVQDNPQHRVGIEVDAFAEGVGELSLVAADFEETVEILQVAVADGLRLAGEAAQFVQMLVVFQLVQSFLAQLSKH